jgi:hypothetical protein
MDYKLVEILFILFLALISSLKSDVILKQDGFSNPINFFQAIEQIKHRINFHKNLENKIDLTSDLLANNINHNHIVDSFNNLLDKSSDSLGISDDCNDQLKIWTTAVKKKELWALTGLNFLCFCLSISTIFTILFMFKFLMHLESHRVVF